MQNTLRSLVHAAMPQVQRWHANQCAKQRDRVRVQDACPAQVACARTHSAWRARGTTPVRSPQEQVSKRSRTCAHGRGMGTGRGSHGASTAEKTTVRGKVYGECTEGLPCWFCVCCRFYNCTPCDFTKCAGTRQRSPKTRARPPKEIAAPNE